MRRAFHQGAPPHVEEREARRAVGKHDHHVLQSVRLAAGAARRHCARAEGARADVIGATWKELDLEAAVWTIPAARMKAHRQHRVPLSPQAIRLLKALPRDGERVFPLSNMAMLALLQDDDRMGRADLTVHGFRS